MPVLLVQATAVPPGWKRERWRWWAWPPSSATCTRCSSASRAARAWPPSRRGVRHRLGAGHRDRPHLADHRVLLPLFLARLAGLGGLRAGVLPAGRPPGSGMRNGRSPWRCSRWRCCWRWPTAPTSSGSCRARSRGWERRPEPRAPHTRCAFRSRRDRAVCSLSCDSLEAARKASITCRTFAWGSPYRDDRHRGARVPSVSTHLQPAVFLDQVAPQPSDHGLVERHQLDDSRTESGDFTLGE